MEESQLVKNMTIDVRLDSYRTFVDHAWAAKVMSATLKTPLDAPIFDLCVAWRGIANTFAFPFITLSMFKGFSTGLLKSHDPFGTKWIRATREKLVARMGDSLNNMKQKRLQTVLTEIYNETKSAIDDQDVVLDENGMWEDLLEKYEMQAAIWGSQRLAYGALYYSYEDFVVRCMKIRLNKAKYRLKRGKEAEDEFTAAFDEAACKYCWSDRDVAIARETRHALVHNGGRLTDALRCRTPGFHVGADQELHLMSPHIRSLHDMLKDRITYLVRLILNLDQSWPNSQAVVKMDSDQAESGPGE